MDRDFGSLCLRRSASTTVSPVAEGTQQGPCSRGSTEEDGPWVLGMRSDVYLFVQLYVAVLVAVVNGSIFCFGLIAPALEAKPFGFSTRNINTVSTVGVIASYTSLPTGFLYDRTSPRVTLLVGATISVLGWSLMYAAFAGAVGQSVTHVCICYYVSQLAASFFETGSVLPTLDAFSQHEGRVVIIQKTFMGLGTSIIAAVYNAFFIGLDLRYFFAFLCLLGGLVGSIGAALIKRPHQHTALFVKGLNKGTLADVKVRYKRAFSAGFAILGGTICFVFAVNVYQSVVKVTDEAYHGFGVAAVMLVLLMGIMVPIVLFDRPTSQDSEYRVANDRAGAPADDGDLQELTVEKNYAGLLHNLRLPMLWLMWFVCFATWGAMTLVNANSSQIYKALVGPSNFDAARNGVFVSLFGLGSALGRVIAGLSKEYLLIPRSIEVWWLFPVAPCVMTPALPLFLILPPDYLFVPFTLVGIATGITWGSTVLIVKRIFAETGRHYAFLYTAGMLTPLFFNLWLFSSSYESHSEAQKQPSLADCNGQECILMPLCVAAGFGVLALAAAIGFARLCEAGGFRSSRTSITSAFE